MSQFLWTQKQDIGPGSRSNSAMGFESKQNRMVLFGGLAAGSPASDTWVFDGNNWTQFADTGPSTRSEHAVAYDSARQRLVLFGGVRPSGSGQSYLGDTWEWDGAEWTQIEDTGPAPRSGMAMCFDSLRGRVCMFGGGNATKQFNDTWSWDGTSWTQEQDTGPAARTKHGLAYDVARDRVVLFGGFSVTTAQTQVTVTDHSWWGGTSSHTETHTATSYQFFDDTWEYNGAMWTRVADTGPAARHSFGIAYNGKATLLLGGRDGTTTFRDTWQWNGAHWTERQEIGPSSRSALAAGYDSTRDRMVIFGGTAADTTSLLGDTWDGFERP
ncbi:MAG: kelch repeat-containing protein [Gemmatimonadales bacterium]